MTLLSRNPHRKGASYSKLAVTRRLFTKDEPRSGNPGSCSLRSPVPPAAIAATSLRICCRVRSDVRAVVSAPGLKLAVPGSAQRHRIARQRRRSAYRVLVSSSVCKCLTIWRACCGVSMADSRTSNGDTTVVNRSASCHLGPLAWGDSPERRSTALAVRLTGPGKRGQFFNLLIWLRLVLRHYASGLTSSFDLSI
jgi:hypothetical protein